MDIASFYSDLVFKRTYAKSFGETWEEAVKRYEEHFWQFVKPEVAKDYVTAIALFKSKDILGSMRGLASAGRALPYYPEAIYNCSYLIFDSWEAFADMFILLMLGVGVGYSVEKASIKLPPRPTKFREGNITIVVGDSKEGWRDAFLSLLYNLQGGMIPKFDYSLIRPAGAPLKTFGGTASGPEPLRFLFDKTIELFTTKPGKQWTPKEIFTLANLVANTVISGGVRRSACIALADYEDAFNLKYDGFWETEPWLAYSNVSIAIDNTIEVNVKDLVHHWKVNNIGEPGIFNRKYAKDKQWVKLRRDLYDEQFLGTNPCGEIILRPFQFCNLTEVHVEPDDTKETLIVKAKMATLLGILQSLNTDYTAVLDPRWKQNAETEPLLGVSLTGLRNHPILSEHSFNTERILTDLRREVREYAKQVAEIYGLPEIKAITTVKPSGTASQILGTTPGLHNSFGRYVIRRLRINKNDPLVDYLKSFGFELFQDVYNNETLVVEFPLEYPNHRDRDVVEQIEYYLMMEWVWADHNPSTTITVKDDIEWEIVEDWLKQHLDKIVGITFLPDNNSFPQAPYEVIDKETYDSMVKKLRKASKKKAEFLIDSSVLESHSNTSAAFACSAGGDCETNVL